MAKKDKPETAIVVRKQDKRKEMKFNAEALIAKAIAEKVPVETMERLLKMRADLKAEFAQEEFVNAMSNFQAECPTIMKTNIVKDKSQKERYRYAPLDKIVEQVKAPLQRNGLSYTVDAKVEGNLVTAICKITHYLGHHETSSFSIPIDPEAYMNEAQKFASALTFAKRYAFCNALGILTGDADDDSIVTGEQITTSTPSAPARKPYSFGPEEQTPNKQEMKATTPEQNLKMLLQQIENKVKDKPTAERWLAKLKENKDLDKAKKSMLTGVLKNKIALFS